MSAEPMVGNLAWAPLPAFEEVEVLDRFNGVPSLGLFGQPGSKTLFWRALGYVPPRGISVWVYIPLDSGDEQHLESADPSALLRGLFFESPGCRRVTLGMALDNRLFAEFQWDLRPGASADALITEMLGFLKSSLAAMAEEATTTPSRRRTARNASKAVRELAAT